LGDWDFLGGAAYTGALSFFFQKSPYAAREGGLSERVYMNRVAGIGVKDDQRAIAFFACTAALIVPFLSITAYSRNLLWQDPVTLWRDTIRKSPGKARPRYNLAQWYEQQGYLELAAENYRAAIKLKPDDGKAHNNLGNVYLAQGDLEGAISEFQTALKIKPDAPLTHDNLGYAYFKQGRLDESIKEYRTALKLAPDIAEIHNNLGYVYIIQRRFDEARVEFRTALGLKPDLAAARDNMDLLERTITR
jgi:Flp pilus assembly protein TadD